LDSRAFQSLNDDRQLWVSMDATPDPPTDDLQQARRGALQVSVAFLKLGLTSFGGPIAHIAYFRQDLIVRRRWMDEAAYADIVALCQLLPGPTSSQVGFAIGLSQAGVAGGVAAFAGFTAPSALIMFAAAAGLPLLNGELGLALLHGLMLVAVSIVAQAVFGMARSFCKTPATALVGLAALVVVLVVSAAWVQPVVILGGGIIGLLVLPKKRSTPDPRGPHGNASAGILLGVFAVLLVFLPLLASGSSQGLLSVADAFYRSGAFVFGGGHVVLPLLEVETVGRGWLDQQAFLAGYGAAQALPGPLFTFAGYLGAVSNSGAPAFIAGPLALAMIFLPGFLLVAAALPLWCRLRNRPGATAFTGGASASVVGLLAAALWDPVIRSAVLGPADIGIASLGFLLLQVFRAQPLLVIPLIVATSIGVDIAVT
jgi:chromate transporter